MKRSSFFQLNNGSKAPLPFKGKEYENQNNQEQSPLQSYGGRLIFSSGEIAFSSYDLIQKEAKLIVDTRGKFKNSKKVVKA